MTGEDDTNRGAEDGTPPDPRDRTGAGTTSTDPVAAFRLTADAAQHVAGVIAARHRGDFDGAETLLACLTDHQRAAGGLFLAELAVSLVACLEGSEPDAVCGRLSLQLAAITPSAGE